jgi:hypothetical protein
MPGRDTIRQKSAARTAASAGDSTAGAVSINATCAPLRRAPWSTVASRAGGQATTEG